MKKIADEQRKKYPFAADIMDIIDKYKDEELLENLESYALDIMSESADMLNKQLLLGTVGLYGPSEWDDWTDEEKLEMFDRWDIIEKMIALSKLGLYKKQNDGDDEEDPNQNNGKGMVC